MTDKEVMQMALTALCNSSQPAWGYRRNELHLTPKPHIEIYQEAIEALRTALAQPEEKLFTEPQEAIDKWIKANTEHREWYICPKCSYQAPRFKDEWVGLTDEELQEIYQGGGTVHFKLAMAEAKLKDKNSGI